MVGQSCLHCGGSEAMRERERERNQCLESQKRVLAPLELELQVAVSLLTWVLETELRFSRRAATIFNCSAMSPVQSCIIFKYCLHIIDQHH